ncbi:MAG: hypothetical protein MI748_10290 [Opitutales bacterium]|nr:hypothetical protein [Opitutales bacterium]
MSRDEPNTEFYRLKHETSEIVYAVSFDSQDRVKAVDSVFYQTRFE